MSKVSESRLWRWLDKGTKRHFRKDLHLNRIENLVMEGMPDVEGCLVSTQFWIELKCNARPSSSMTIVKPKFRPAQIPWLERRVAVGGQAFVLLQVGGGQKASRYLVPGHLADILEKGATEEGLEQLSITDPQASAIEIIEAAVRG